MKSGVYVHIPFCEQRCYYCAFTVAVSGEETYQPYVQRLIREITLSEFVEPPETIFFGGGTPSIVDANSIANIISVFPEGAVEISLEANPGTLTEAKLETYGCAGVNRINVGGVTLMLSFVLLLFIGLLAILPQTYHAANENPTRNLGSE